MLSFVRRFVALIFIVTAAYLATVFFIMSEDDSKEVTIEPAIEKLEPEAIIQLESQQRIPVAATMEEAQPTVIVTGLQRASCSLGALHNELVNKFIRGEDYSVVLQKISQIPALPQAVQEWLQLLDTYQDLVPEEQEILSLDQGVWGWLFAKTLRITLVNDHLQQQRELHAQILEGMPVFNDFVFNAVYPKGCSNVYN